MKYDRINGHDFYNMVVNASNRLLEESDFVNALNVFPVPDGDTGTNMSMTFKAAVKEIENLNSESIGETSKKLAKGALMGARGNSGVILSQILRGISKGLEGKTSVRINGHDFYNMVVNASNRLLEESDFVNALNVFPVPDGDTGTNMSMTFKAAVKEIENLNSESIGETSKKLAKGALMGARGNSGVILSQILRGISKGLEGKTSVDSKEFANAFVEGSKAAYKAVMKPTEGTILSVIRAASEAATHSDKTDIVELLSEIVIEAKVMLDKTPDLLPALKKAKVVDSGGMGLYIILQGMYDALKDGIKAEIKDITAKGSVGASAEALEDIDIKFGYCTEFIILGDAAKAKAFQDEIEPLGDSMIVVGYDDVIKVHIHTNDPGLVLSKAVTVGELSKIKIDNMREEHREVLLSKEEYAAGNAKEVESEAVSEKKKYAFISVAMGEGITNVI